MSTINYKCDTCKREIEILENRQGLTVLGKCIITNGCRGHLYKTGRNAYNVRESLPESSVSDLQDYFPRRVFFEFKQQILSDKWRITHNLGVNPAIVVYFFDNNDQPFIADIDEYEINVVNKNVVEIILPQQRTGIVHCISRNTKELEPEGIVVIDDLHKVEYSGVITLAFIKTITNADNPSESPFNTENANIRIEISIQEPNQEPIFCEEDFDGINFLSPWSDWNKILVRKRRNYNVRSRSLMDFLVFQENYDSLKDIPDGTIMRIHRIDYGDGMFRDIISRNALLLLANEPYQNIDKNLNGLIDVGEVEGSSISNHYTFVNNEMFVHKNHLEKIYPKIQLDIPSTPLPSPTPTSTVTPTLTPTPSITVTPTITPTITVTPTITPTNTITPTPSSSTLNNLLFSTGINFEGITGLGTDMGITVNFTQVGSDTDWELISADTNHSLVIKNDGTLWTFGDNSFGGTGLGTDSGDTLSPTQIGTDMDWETIAADGNCSLALKSDGTLWSWGSNANGQTGLGTDTGNTLTPTQVGSDTDWEIISNGNSHALALKSDGTLWSWGSNTSGQTGLGTDTGNTLTPTQVGSDTDWEIIDAGPSHSLAIKTNGALWSWGDNNSGATGLGTDTGNTLTPTQVGTDTDWILCSGGSDYSLVLKSSGALWTFGNNADGRTGLNTSSGNTLTPTQIGSDLDWVRIGAGSNHSIAIKFNGSLWSWGSNINGATGSGTTSGNILIPTQVGSDTNWAKVSTGTNHSLTIKQTL